MMKKSTQWYVEINNLIFGKKKEKTQRIFDFALAPASDLRC